MASYEVGITTIETARGHYFATVTDEDAQAKYNRDVVDLDDAEILHLAWGSKDLEGDFFESVGIESKDITFFQGNGVEA